MEECIRGYRIMIIMSPFQGENAGLIPATRSKEIKALWPIFYSHTHALANL